MRCGVRQVMKDKAKGNNEKPKNTSDLLVECSKCKITIHLENDLYSMDKYKNYFCVECRKSLSCGSCK